jgi:hypothetical protein
MTELGLSKNGTSDRRGRQRSMQPPTGSIVRTPDDNKRAIALRTAFLARFIVLREGRRSRAHRLIEDLAWNENSTAYEVAELIRQSFIKNGDKLGPVERDIRRALQHAECSARYFADQYSERSTKSFREALVDYQRSNKMLFGEDPDEVPRKGGWRHQIDAAQENI